MIDVLTPENAPRLTELSGDVPRLLRLSPLARGRRRAARPPLAMTSPRVLRTIRKATGPEVAQWTPTAPRSCLARLDLEG